MKTSTDYQQRAARGALNAEAAEARGDHEAADYYREYSQVHAEHALAVERQGD